MHHPEVIYSNLCINTSSFNIFGFMHHPELIHSNLCINTFRASDRLKLNRQTLKNLIKMKINIH